MGYEQFFGLNDAPFSLAPNPRYLFDSASHRAALEQLTQAIERREPLIVMTGEIGTGKTLLCRTVLQRLDRKTFVSVINDPLLEPDDLLTQMLQDFGIMSADRTAVPATSRHDRVRALEDFLSSLVVLDARAVVIIDEAQHVQPDVLEQIRLLSNIDAPSGTMLQIILAGQLNLDPLLARPELRQFQQRVSRRIRLEPLGESELRAYIDHRLAVGRSAGSRMPGAGDLANALGEWERADGGVAFTPDATQAIWRWSSGLPRLVNLLCDRSLELAFAQRLRTIDAGLVDTAATALGLKPGPATPVASVPEPVKIPTPSFADEFKAVPMATASESEPVSIAIGKESEPAPFAMRHQSGPASIAMREDLEPAAPPVRSRVPLLSALVVVLSVTAAVTWYLTRVPAEPVTGSSTAAPARQPATAAPAPAVSPSTGTPASTPGGGSPAATPVVPPAPGGRAITPSGVKAAPEPPPAAAPAGAKAAAPAGATSFEILVASFRTEERAALVATQVSSMGLTVRRRAVGGWFQVITGPFPSRETADAAHQRLDGAGLTGSQIVSIDR